MTRSILIASLAIALTGCVLTAKPTSTSLSSVVKPTTKQISENAEQVVCKSFSYIFFRSKNDSAATIKAVRQHNAALKSFGCKVK